MVDIGHKMNEEFRQQGGFEELHFSPKQIRIFMSRWTRSLPYLKNLLESEHRYDISGEIAQPITEDQKQYAQEAIKKRINRIKNNKKSGE
jgi:sRNA-binding protein